MGIFNVLIPQMVLANIKAGTIIHYPTEMTSHLPDFFDSRERWPNCLSVKEIKDQGRCGACWAIAPAQVMTDRVCIHSNGTENFQFSTEDIVSCTSINQGCGGGSPIPVWREWGKNGYVSGGNYNSNQGCKPYSFPNCPNHMKNCLNYSPTPVCQPTCRSGYLSSYSADKRRGKPYYVLKQEMDIMADIYYKGPVVAIMYLYEDFGDYKRGVYRHRRGTQRGSHVVKMIGWGIENGDKYWLVANSWGKDFGDDGFFKILRGANECEIEYLVTAADPILESNLAW